MINSYIDRFLDQYSLLSLVPIIVCMWKHISNSVQCMFLYLIIQFGLFIIDKGHLNSIKWHLNAEIIYLSFIKYRNRIHIIYFTRTILKQKIMGPKMFVLCTKWLNLKLSTHDLFNRLQIYLSFFKFRYVQLSSLFVTFKMILIDSLGHTFKLLF